MRTFRHAIALDERRAKFKANLWNRPNEREAKLGIPSTPSIRSLEVHDSEKEKEDEDDDHDEKFVSQPLKKGAKPRKKSNHESEDDQELTTLERLYSETHARKTDIKEVWFAVSHCASLDFPFADVLISSRQGCHCGSSFGQFHDGEVLMQCVQTSEVVQSATKRRTPSRAFLFAG